ncbi:MAG: NAD(P)/FAD-dependent oxidoreductase [Patescibacteria group bacterium]
MRYNEVVKNIVILGGGFAGLRAAQDIGNEVRRRGLSNRYRVFLIDRNPNHTFTPLLYEIATTAETLADRRKLCSLVAFPFKDLLENTEVTTLREEVTALNLSTKTINFPRQSLIFSYLLIAAGTESNLFDIPGLAEHALTLKSFDDAIRIRDTIEKAAHTDTEKLSVVIGGGGPTGVELAGEIRLWLGELSEAGARLSDTEVLLVERSPRILPGFPNRFVRTAEQRLKKLGVRVRTNSDISEAREGAVSLTDGTVIPAHVLVWTGGVRTPAFLEHLPFTLNPQGRVAVTPTLAASSDGHELHGIYVAGDNADIRYPGSSEPVPQVAHAATESGKVAAKNIIREIERAEGLGNRLPLPYRPWRYPYILPVGGKYAIAKIGLFVVSGFLAWVFKGIVELAYFLSIMPVFSALRIWFRGLRVFIKNDRLG